MVRLKKRGDRKLPDLRGMDKADREALQKHFDTVNRENREDLETLAQAIKAISGTVTPT